MKKQFLRVKQIADQTFLRAEKSEVLPEELAAAERRVDCIRSALQAANKRVAALAQDSPCAEADKRLKKVPQVLLGASMLESGCSFARNSILGETLRESGGVQSRLGSELFDHCTEVERSVLKPISAVLESEVHNISKLRKQLGKLVLDMDSARTRFGTAERHSLQQVGGGGAAAGKVDTLKEELEDAQQRVEQTRDTLATEMFSLISREPYLARLFLQLHQSQASYHRNALATLEAALPALEHLINDFSLQPVFGCSLEEHLRVTGREVAQVIETCVTFLLDYGILEEGLLRVAGSALKVKKLKSALDAGIELDLEEYARDPHAVAGAFKCYLRELPEPLLTHALYSDWMDAAKEAEVDVKLQSLWQVLHKLPAVHFTNLKYVIKFLAKVQENMDVNKMSSQNIAIVMAPNLIWSPTEENTTIGMNMSTASLHTSIVDTLISYAHWFFPEDADDSPPQPPNMDEQLFDKEENGNNPDFLNRAPQNRSFRKPAPPPPPLIDLLGEETHEKCVPPSYSSLSLERKRCPPRPSVPPPDRPHNNSQDVSSAKYSEDSAEGSQNVSMENDIPLPTLVSGTTQEVQDVHELVQNQTLSQTLPKEPPPTLPRPPRQPPDSAEAPREDERPPKAPPVTLPRSKEAERPPVASRTSKPKDGEDQPSTVQRSASQMNRFDFLVSQREERPPPERPPRSTESSQEPPPSPREAARPPRPQPPAKPKLLPLENTNL